MNSVFIVDDESLVISSLIASVDWYGLGYEVIGEAGNGIEAYEKILRCRPDIVFTDIRMPGFSGLELIKKVNDTLPNIQFVVMSGYAEFAYVQKALSYGALGYCLKPFDEIEIESILKKACKIISHNKRSLEMELLSVIDDISEYGCVRRKEIIRQIGMEWEEKEGVYAVANEGIPEVKLSKDIRTIGFKIGRNKYIQLVPAHSIDNMLEIITGKNHESSGCMGISSIIYSTDYISPAIEEACIALYHYFVTGKKAAYRYFEPERTVITDRFVKLRNYAASGNIIDAVKMLDSMEACFLKGDYNIIQAFQVCNIVMYANAAANNTTYESIIYNYEHLLTMFENIKEMFSYLKTVIKQTEPAVHNIFSDIKNDTLRNILKYVNDYFWEDISIQCISKKFNVNPCYLSQLFKKETGITFTDYITDLRIKYACSLLKTTDMSMNEISEKVGFSDYYYFTRVFKKVVGETPTHYKQK